VDEGNNWINISWGPLTLTNISNGSLNGTTLGNYALAAGSPAIDAIPTSSPTFALTPRTDFFGNPRPETPNATTFDIGAIEFQGVVATPTLTSIAPN
jgi:hypothetical protein